MSITLLLFPPLCNILFNLVMIRRAGCWLSVSADVGADILDLAETMITSSGLQYEPVSGTSSAFLLILLFFLP